jgi:hypothetical protein
VDTSSWACSVFSWNGSTFQHSRLLNESLQACLHLLAASSALALLAFVMTAATVVFHLQGVQGGTAASCQPYVCLACQRTADKGFQEASNDCGEQQGKRASHAVKFRAVAAGPSGRALFDGVPYLSWQLLHHRRHLTMQGCPTSRIAASSIGHVAARRLCLVSCACWVITCIVADQRSSGHQKSRASKQLRQLQT